MENKGIEHEHLLLDLSVAEFIQNLNDDKLINDIVESLSDVAYHESECVALACLDRFFMVYYYLDQEYAVVFDYIEEIDCDKYLDLMSDGCKYHY